MTEFSLLGNLSFNKQQSVDSSHHGAICDSVWIELCGSREAWKNILWLTMDLV